MWKRSIDFDASSNKMLQKHKLNEMIQNSRKFSFVNFCIYDNVFDLLFLNYGPFF